MKKKPEMQERTITVFYQKTSLVVSFLFDIYCKNIYNFEYNPKRPFLPSNLALVS